MDKPGYVKISEETQGEEASTCGVRKRLFKKDDGVPMSVSRLRIQDARPHWHKHTHEYYYILQGAGVLVIDGDRVPVRPGDCIWIQPGHVHHAEGDIETLVIACPAYDPADTHFDVPAADAAARP